MKVTEEKLEEYVEVIEGETKKVVDAIVSDQTDIENSILESTEEPYSYEESDF